MKVLVVDDAPEVVDSVRLGFSVQWREVDLLSAGTGQQALDLVEKESPTWSCWMSACPTWMGSKCSRSCGSSPMYRW